MSRHFLILVALLAAAAQAQEAPKPVAKQQTKQQIKQTGDAAKQDKSAPPDAAATDGEPKTLSGISILGNQEAPKSLVIVPWKGSQIGEMPGLSRLLDDAVQPVDKDVFMRELAYFEIRSNSR